MKLTKHPAVHLLGLLLHANLPLRRRDPPHRLPQRRQHHRQRLRVPNLQSRAQRPRPRPILGQRPTLQRPRHAGARPLSPTIRRRDHLPGFSLRAQLPPLAQPRQRNRQEGLRHTRDVLF